MFVVIRIRNVPDKLHRRLKARAARNGQSLSDYLLNEIRQAAERPTVEELGVRLQSLPRSNPNPSPAEAVRAERDSR